MHYANQLFWDDCSKKYSRYFCGPENVRILEVGSLYVNGSVRPYFKCFSEYVGVDWRPGKNVDVVCLAHEMHFDHQFDVVISASMLEHDPYWEKSIPRMIDCLKQDGILLLSWGAAYNGCHCVDTAPDNKFHSLPAIRVLNLLKDFGITIHQFRYEYLLPYLTKQANIGLDHGCVALSGFKDAEIAKIFGKGHIDILLDKDQI
jgi:SAM-dependent methyltransferase